MDALNLHLKRPWVPNCMALVLSSVRRAKTCFKVVRTTGMPKAKKSTTPAELQVSSFPHLFPHSISSSLPSSLHPLIRHPMSTPLPQRVLIAGAGLGGLLLAILLERAGIEYHVYEKHEEFRALGSVTSLSANIMPVFDQLGLLGELLEISLVMSEINVYNPKMTRVGHINVHIQKEK